MKRMNSDANFFFFSMSTISTSRYIAQPIPGTCLAKLHLLVTHAWRYRRWTDTKKTDGNRKSGQKKEP